MTPWPHSVPEPSPVGVDRSLVWPAPAPIPDGTVVAEAASVQTGMRVGSWHVDQLADACATLAAGGATVVTTGPFSPSWRGTARLGIAALTSARQARHHRQATGAVHRYGARVLLLLQHAGCAASTPWRVLPSGGAGLPSPTEAGVRRVIRDHARSAALAIEGGYDGVEIDATRDALPGQFLDPYLNRRDDGWGGSEPNRHRLLTEVVRAVRAATHGRVLVVVRLDGTAGPGAAVSRVERAVAAAGVDAITRTDPDGLLRASEPPRG